MSTKHIYLIITLVILISAATFLLINKFTEPQSNELIEKTSIKLPIINQPSGEFVCEDLHNEIENDLEKTNYCQTDSDCDVIMLGGTYIEFGCYHYINKQIDKEQFYKKMDIYNQKCSLSINDCGSGPDAKCISNKCVSVEER